jgi:hypothetical protein
MTAPRSSGRSRRGERGGVSWVTLLLLGALAAGGYLGWVWAPLWLEFYAVKQVVHDYMNQAIKNPDDEGLRRNMVLKIRTLAEAEAVDRFGRPARVSAIELDDRRVTWQRDLRGEPPTLRVAFEYERRVVYPLLERAEVRVFDVDVTRDLMRANWGPAR